MQREKGQNREGFETRVTSLGTRDGHCDCDANQEMEREKNLKVRDLMNRLQMTRRVSEREKGNGLRKKSRGLLSGVYSSESSVERGQDGKKDWTNEKIKSKGPKVIPTCIVV